MDNNKNNILDILNNYQPSGPDEKLKTAIFAESEHKTKGSSYVLRWLSTAAAIGILLSVSFYVYFSSKPVIETEKATTTIANNDTIEDIIKPKAEKEKLSLADIEDRIEKAGMAARELAIADIFAKDSGNREYAIKQYQSIIDTYPDFEQAEIAKNKLTTLQKGI